MRRSYLIPQRDGVFSLTAEVADQLGIERDGLLYAVVEKDGSGELPSLLLSAIPPQLWQSAYRLIVNIAAPAGSLAKVAAALSGLRINLLLGWAAADSPLRRGRPDFRGASPRA